MKTFEIKSKGTLSQYVKDNAIKAKGEINKFVFEEEFKGTSCYCISLRFPEMSKGLSVSL